LFARDKRRETSKKVNVKEMFGFGIGSQSPLGFGAGIGNNNNNHNNGTSDQEEEAEEKDKKCFVQQYLTNCESFYSCIHCRTHVADHDDLVSRSFQGNSSRAYLFDKVVNIFCGPSVRRELNTGAHSVADIYCANCGTVMGWKYEKAFVESQKYKEGKYIIELAHVFRENRRLDFDKSDIIQNENCNLMFYYICNDFF